MGVLDVLFSRAPAAIASGLKGQREGREYQDEIKRRALQDSLAERRTAVAEEGQATKNELADLRGRLDPERLKGYLQQVYQSDPRRAAQGRVEGEVTGRENMGLSPERPRNIDPNAPETLAARYAHEREMALLNASLRPKDGDKPARQTDSDKKTQALYAAGKNGYDTLEGLLKNGKGVPGLVASQMAKVGLGTGNYLTSDEYRRMRQSALVLSDAWLRYTSGAAVPETEVARFAESFVPVPGDENDPELMKQKAASRKTIIEAMRNAAGGGSTPAPSTGQAPPPSDNAEAAALAFLAKRRAKKS